MKLMRLAALLCASACLAAGTVRGEELSAIFERVSKLVAAGNYPKAMDELGWAREEIQKMHVSKLQSFFPDSVVGYTGQKVEAKNALGFSNFERSYTKSGGGIHVSLTGGAGSGGNAAFGNLAALGKMAAMFGQQDGQETVRVSGRTATLSSGANHPQPELTVYLDSGSVLQLTLTQGKDPVILTGFAEALKIGDLDEYLRGSGK